VRVFECWDRQTYRTENSEQIEGGGVQKGAWGQDHRPVCRRRGHKNKKKKKTTVAASVARTAADSQSDSLTMCKAIRLLLTDYVGITVGVRIVNIDANAMQKNRVSIA
jgi:hypothetical protein